MKGMYRTLVCLLISACLTQSAFAAHSHKKAASSTPPVRNYDELANAQFQDNFPTAEAAQKLRDELLFERAVQVYLWSLPAMSMASMKQGMAMSFDPGYNMMPIWNDRVNGKTQVPTPNSDYIYGLTFLDLKRSGPIVIEVPPKLQGILNDAFQRPICGVIANKTWCGDLGFAGPDGGNGGNYVILPPDYQGTVPAGYYPYRSRTYGALISFRSFYSDPTKLEQATDQLTHTRIYPLGKKSSAKVMEFPNASETGSNLLFSKGASYYTMLSRFINDEYVDPADMDMRGMLASIGIVKGQKFEPDAHTRAILDKAAKTAFNISKVMMYDSPKKADAHYYDDRQWVNVFANGSAEFQPTGTYTDLDRRAAYFVTAFATSPAMAKMGVGASSKYPITWRDAQGNYLDGGTSYQMHLPANVPANFWSVAIYDAGNAESLKNGRSFPAINSADHPVANADGSYDFYFGPTPPPGKEHNWLKTVPNKGYFVMLRLYNPMQTFFDQSWKPGDVEKGYVLASQNPAPAAQVAGAPASPQSANRPLSANTNGSGTPANGSKDVATVPSGDNNSPANAVGSADDSKHDDSSED